MAFKRSAVRSRLSPPKPKIRSVKKSSEIVWFQDFFFCFNYHNVSFSGARLLLDTTNQIRATFLTRVLHELGCFRKRNNVPIQSSSAVRKCFIKSLDGRLFRGFLCMGIIHCHVDFGVSNQSLDRLGIHAKLKHMCNICMSAAVWC